jgi:hypothetical protein
MNKQDAAFAAKMCDLSEKGVDFQVFARKVLKEFLGESPSEVLFIFLGAKAARRPDLFPDRLRRIFGEGAHALMRELMERADAYEPAPKAEKPLHEVLAYQIRGEGHSQGVSATYLHDHRMRDEWDDMIRNRAK